MNDPSSDICSCCSPPAVPVFQGFVSYLCSALGLVWWYLVTFGFLGLCLIHLRFLLRSPFLFVTTDPGCRCCFLFSSDGLYRGLLIISFHFITAAFWCFVWNSTVSTLELRASIRPAVSVEVMRPSPSVCILSVMSAEIDFSTCQLYFHCLCQSRFTKS